MRVWRDWAVAAPASSEPVRISRKGLCVEKQPGRLATMDFLSAVLLALTHFSPTMKRNAWPIFHAQKHTIRETKEVGLTAASTDDSRTNV